MCTLTFVPKNEGYIAGMNRDELLMRARALPPTISERNGVKGIFPREATGGTWIACNDQGTLLALLNWNDIDTRLLGVQQKTRGIVIPELIFESDSAATEARFDRLSLDGVFPFRLIGAFPKERVVIEWRWNGAERQKLCFPWTRKHWFSSSLSDAIAERERGRACENSRAGQNIGTSAWLAGLHRSHLPSPGPFSICMHRRDAATVSYAEVDCGRSSIAMSHLSGSPCMKNDFDEVASINLNELRAVRLFA